MDVKDPPHGMRTLSTKNREDEDKKLEAELEQLKKQINKQLSKVQSDAALKDVSPDKESHE